MDYSELTFALQARRLAFERMNEAARKSCTGPIQTLDEDFARHFKALDFEVFVRSAVKDAHATAELIRKLSLE